jgi:hypothetical protein
VIINCYKVKLLYVAQVYVSPDGSVGNVVSDAAVEEQGVLVYD